MTSFFFVSEKAFLGAAAVVVKRTSQGNTHAGILHSQGEVLHLGWENTLLTNWPGAQLWATPPADQANLETVAGLCRLVLRKFLRTQTFPYGFSFEGTKISATGELAPGPGTYGVTCSTFVVVMFERAGIRLVDPTTWPRGLDEDKAFILQLCLHHAAPEHAAVLASEAAGGVRRIRPEEVLGACACELPASFDAASIASREVLGRLNELAK
jgi:hypothetical protein